MGLCRRTADGLAFDIRVIANASDDRIEGIRTRDDGSERLLVRVRAVPDRQKANGAVIALLAEKFDIPKSAIAITAGDKGRDKTIGLTLEKAEADRVVGLFG